MKILYVATVSGTINSFLIPHIELLIKQGHKVDVACNIGVPIDQRVIDQCNVFNVKFDRSPLARGNLIAYKKLTELINSEKYDLVHTHTPVASTIVRLVTRKTKNIKVMYTAHGFHFFNGAPIKNWLIYYPIELFLSKYTDVLITINSEDYQRAKQKFSAKKTEYIPGVGINLKNVDSIFIDRNAKRKELGIPEDATVLLSVGELNNNKNHETVIRAVSKLKKTKIVYIICGRGPLESHLKQISKELNVDNQVKILGFRQDIIEICKATDLFVFPSFREGLSVALMEAMATGLPVICSDIRGNRDLILHNEGGFLVNPSDIDGFTSHINELHKNKELCLNMSEYNKGNVVSMEITSVLEKLNEIYLKTIKDTSMDKKQQGCI